MKKVLVIAPYPYLPYYSGGQKFIAQFLHYLGKETALTVISTRDNDKRMALTYTLLPLLSNSIFRYIDFRLVRKITAIIRKEQFDTVIWEHPYYSWLANRIRKRTGIRTFIHTHNIEYQRFRSIGKWWWPVLKVYEKSCFQKADGIFFITPEDKQFAIREWQVDSAKCHDLPFGVEVKEHPADKALCRHQLLQQYALPGNTRLLLFNGALGYKPNLAALKAILDQVNPLLMQQNGPAYKIIICGKGLPDEMNRLEAYKDKHIIYAGFVEEIEPYFKGADIFLNPVQSGGGVKTKMVESLACGTTVIAVATGAAGMDKAVCGDKLVIVDDNDWEGFAKAISDHISDITRTPKDFYDLYYWENITRRISGII